MKDYSFFIFAAAAIFVTTNLAAKAQDIGLLASHLNKSCQDFSALNFDFTKIYAPSANSAAFCYGYFEAIIEQKQFNEGKDIFRCFPTYAYYDAFRKSVFRRFMYEFRRHHSNGDEYVRAFNLAHYAVDKEYDMACVK